MCFGFACFTCHRAILCSADGLISRQDSGTLRSVCIANLMLMLVLMLDDDADADADAGLCR
jgi:hypothetical protein